MGIPHESCWSRDLSCKSPEYALKRLRVGVYFFSVSVSFVVNTFHSFSVFLLAFNKKIVQHPKRESHGQSTEKVTCPRSLTLIGQPVCEPAAASRVTCTSALTLIGQPVCERAAQ